MANDAHNKGLRIEGSGGGGGQLKLLKLFYFQANKTTKENKLILTAVLINKSMSKIMH
jgi:hypothetical protein